MRFIVDALGLGGFQEFTGAPMSAPGQAVYKSPSGARVPFDFEDVTSGYESKAAPFESATGNGTYVQPNGHTSGRFPMVAFFYGPGYEKRAEAFLSAVLEGGVGVLTHPQYRQPINVVHIGTIDRQDNFASGTNQTIFTLTFWETTGLLVGEGGDVGQSYDSLLDASAADFSEKVQLGDAVDKASFINSVKAAAKTIETVMKAGSRGLAAATAGIENVGDSIDRGIDLLVGQPLMLARQMQILIGEPARQREMAIAKLEAYGNMATQIFANPDAESSVYSKESINNFHLNGLIAKSVLGVSAVLADGATDQYQSKADYFLQVDSLLSLFDNYRDWSDDNYTALASSTISEPATDTGGGVWDLQQVMTLAVSNLITKSFSARAQMSMVLPAARAPVELAFELYGSSDYDTLDLLAQSNDFSGDEYFEIPKGRHIVWYV